MYRMKNIVSPKARRVGVAVIAAVSLSTMTGCLSNMGRGFGNMIEGAGSMVSGLGTDIGVMVDGTENQVAQENNRRNALRFNGNSSTPTNANWTGRNR